MLYEHRGPCRTTRHPQRGARAHIRSHSVSRPDFVARKTGRGANALPLSHLRRAIADRRRLFEHADESRGRERPHAGNHSGLLADRSWTGRGGVAALGPENLSHDDMAAVLAEVLGRPVRFQPVSEADFTAQMTGRGASADVARWLLDMFHSGGETPHGGAPSQPRTETPTTFRLWCEQVLAPALPT